MKNILSLIISLLIVNCSYAVVEYNTIIQGKITNKSSNSVLLLKELANSTYNWPAFDSTMTDAEGNFSIKLKIENPLVCALSNSGKTVRLFISPNDTLNITMDMLQWPNSLKFTGRGGMENTFYFQFRQQYSGPIAQNKLYGSRPIYFNYLCDSLYSAAGKEFSDFFTNSPSNKNFPIFQRFVKRDDSIEARVDTSYFSFLRKVPFDNPAAYQTDYYAEFFYWYYKERAYQALNNVKLFEDDENILLKQFDIAAAELKNIPREIALAKVITKMLEKNYVTNAGKMIEYMKKSGSSVETVIWLDKTYSKYEHLAKGAQPTDFSYPDSLGKMISLSSLKGNIVYIDFWASWCGPCRREMPYSKKLIETFKDQPVTFLFISIDEDKNRWLSAMRQEKLNGVHIIDQKGWGSELCEKYNFHSIPHYVLIDADGKMSDADAKRPSSGAQQQIQNLLDKINK